MNPNKPIQIVVILLSVIASIQVTAQKKLSDLPPAQAAAVQKYLAQNPELQFLSENRMDQPILKGMRKQFGARLTPFYRTGDFNRDGVQDFGVILVKQGPPSEDQGPGLAETHRYRYEMAIVIFNGQKNGGYRMAFSEKTTAPVVCLLNETNEKRKKLYFGVYETDEQFFIESLKNSYRVK